MQEAGADIIKLNSFNPITVLTAALAITQQKYFPNRQGEVQLDTYFQQEAIKDGKKVIGLETIEIQIKAMFDQLTMQRQVELLDGMFREKDGIKRMIVMMNRAYCLQEIEGLQQVMYGSNYKAEEMKVLLDDRNDEWMKRLPALMKEQPLFVAVGALHLVGKKGLINQLMEQGFTVTAANLIK